MSIFDAGNLKLPAGPFDSRQIAYKRRAYGSVKCVGNDQFDGCAGGATLTFGSDSKGANKYAQGGGLQARGGGRYVPNAHLTSITTKNQGGGDLSDVTLWQIEFQYTCYSKAQLDSMAKSFMIPKNLINVTLGYDPGGSVTISNAQIHDFSWNYNSDDATWTCTGKALGENSQVVSAGAFMIKPNDVGVEVTDDENSVKSYSVVKVLQTEVDKALGIIRSAEGDLTGPNIPNTDGRAKSIGNNAIVKLQIEAGGWSMFVSGGKADDKIVTMTTIQTVIDFFNAKLPQSVKAKGGYKFSGGKYDPRPLLRSADPAAFCLPGLATYGEDNDFKDLQGTTGDIGSVFVSTDLLLKVETDLLNEQSKKTGASEYTIGQFLSKMFGELAQCTGNAIDCFITERDGTFYIVNRTFDIKKGSVGTSVNLFSSNSPVKSCNMSSNFDPEMAAIAFAGASGKFPEGMASGIFSGCTPKEPSDAAAGDGPDAKVQAKIDEMGKAYKAETVSDFKSVLKQYVMSSVKDASFRYGIDISLTLDGAADVRFMQKFTVSPLPGHIGSGTYFVVGEIEHKCDGETWDTSVTGYMMVNV